MKLIENIYFYQGITGLKVGRGAGSSNVTVLTGMNQIMIDTGEPFRKIMKKLKERMFNDGLTLEDTQIILPTHSHWDHMNAVNKIKGMSNAKLLVHPKIIPNFEDPRVEYGDMLNFPPEFKSDLTSMPMFLSKFFLGFFMGKRKKIQVDGTLSDGQVIKNGPISINVIFTPGHSHGHVSYYIPERRTLLAGDILDRELELGGSMNNSRSSYLDLLESINKIQKLDIDIYISGHGDPVIGKDKVARFIASNKEKSENIPDIIMNKLKTRGSRVSELVKEIYPGLPYSQVLMKKMEILIVLQHLESLEKVKRETKKKKIFWFKKD